LITQLQQILKIKKALYFERSENNELQATPSNHALLGHEQKGD
jgi:hypothetical protein